MSKPDTNPNSNSRIDKGMITFAVVIGAIMIVAGIFAANVIPQIFKTVDITSQTQSVLNQTKLELDQRSIAVESNREIINQTQKIIVEINEKLHDYIERSNNTTHRLLLGQNFVLEQQDAELDFLHNSSLERQKILDELNNQTKQNIHILKEMDKVVDKIDNTTGLILKLINLTKTN